MRYFLQLAYNGAPFHGWQVQPNAPSVQAAIERALTLALRCPTGIVGAGRTDTGVNASMMLAHFDTPEPLTPERRESLLRQLNAIVGNDIALLAIHDVPGEAHARFDATSRTYHYYVTTTRNPFIYNSYWRAPVNLDFELMNRAALILLETIDFTSFSKLHTDVKTNNCRVTHAAWHRLDTDRWVFEITADRFLRNMVRAVVGTLVEVGRHKMTIEEFSHVIERRDRCAAGTSMPPHPLYLHRVEYPYLPSLLPAYEP